MAEKQMIKYCQLDISPGQFFHQLGMVRRKKLHHKPQDRVFGALIQTKYRHWPSNTKECKTSNAWKEYRDRVLRLICFTTGFKRSSHTCQRHTIYVRHTCTYPIIYTYIFRLTMYNVHGKKSSQSENIYITVFPNVASFTSLTIILCWSWNSRPK